MLPPVTQLLRADSATTALVAQRIYRRGKAPQNIVTQGVDYVTWFLVDNVPENNLSGRPSSFRAIVQVDCWATSDKGSEALAEAVRQALELHGHQTGQPVDGQDRETGKYRFSLQFDFIVLN
jgi:hypothetical protein